MTGDDQHVLAVTAAIFDGLYAFTRRRIVLGRELP